MQGYRAPHWLPGGNLQTIWPALFSSRFEGGPPAFERERWRTPDGDFIDVDFLQPASPLPAGAPWLVLFHGLEGSSQSHYAQAFAHWIISLPTQDLIASFQVNGSSLFTPDSVPYRVAHR